MRKTVERLKKTKSYRDYKLALELEKELEKEERAEKLLPLYAAIGAGLFYASVLAAMLAL